MTTVSFPIGFFGPSVTAMPLETLTSLAPQVASCVQEERTLDLHRLLTANNIPPAAHAAATLQFSVGFSLFQAFDAYRAWDEGEPSRTEPAIHPDSICRSIQQLVTGTDLLTGPKTFLKSPSIQEPSDDLGGPTLILRGKGTLFLTAPDLSLLLGPLDTYPLGGEGRVRSQGAMARFLFNEALRSLRSHPEASGERLHQLLVTLVNTCIARAEYEGVHAGFDEALALILERQDNPDRAAALLARLAEAARSKP